MPQPAVFMLIGLASWVLVSLAIARKWGVPATKPGLSEAAQPAERLRTWAEALCHRVREGVWPHDVKSWPWATTFDRLLSTRGTDPQHVRAAMLAPAAFAVPLIQSAPAAPKFYRLGTGLALLGLGLAMVAALGQLATIIAQPAPSDQTSDTGHKALASVSISQAGQIGVAALVLLGSAALMNLIARRLRRNAPNLSDSLQNKVQQSLAQSMASEAAAWITTHAATDDTQPLADRLRQFWDVGTSSKQASQPAPTSPSPACAEKAA